MASGHGGHGIHYGPVTAVAIAGMIANGASKYDITGLGPARASTTTA
jgi:glycine/D-amino acid oxidase-like deaminating enzyme